MFFLHTFRQKNTQNASADVPKRRRERAHRRDEATLAPSFFVAEKSCKKTKKNEKSKKGLGHGGIRRSRLCSWSKHSEPPKIEIVDGKRSKKTFFKRA